VKNKCQIITTEKTDELNFHLLLESALFQD